MEVTKDISRSQRHVQGALAHLFTMGGIRFVLGGSVVENETVFSEAGFMPHIATLADELMTALGWPRCVERTVAAEHGLVGLSVRLCDPIPVLAVSALLTAAETMFLDRPIAMSSAPKLVEVQLDEVFTYWRNTQQSNEKVTECPWRNRIPAL